MKKIFILTNLFILSTGIINMTNAITVDTTSSHGDAEAGSVILFKVAKSCKAGSGATAYCPKATKCSADSEGTAVCPNAYTPKGTQKRFGKYSPIQVHCKADSGGTCSWGKSAADTIKALPEYKKFGSYPPEMVQGT